MPTFYSIGKVTEPLFRSARHSHQTWEICLYTEGEGTATVGEDHVPFQPGTIICYPPIIPHEELSTNGCKEFYIHTDIFYNSKVGIPVFSDTQDQQFQQVVGFLYREFLLKEEGWQIATQHLFDLLILYLLRWRGRRCHPLVGQLQRMIQEHMHDPGFSVGVAMRGLPLSSDHLRVLFVEETGKTPTQYLIDLRLNEAQQLLQSGMFSVKEVARRVGYTDPYYFSRHFSKMVGVAPSEYAGRHGEER